MKINVLAPINNYDGTPITNVMQGGSTPQVFTVRNAIVEALNNIGPNENLDADTKARSFVITNKVYTNAEVELGVDDLKLIKDRAGVILTSLAYGRLLEVIDAAQTEA